MIMMPSVEAQDRFGELIEQAQQEPIGITIRGRPVAYIIAEHDLTELQDLSQRREAARQWYASYRDGAATRSEAVSVSDDEINQLVHEFR